jgi:uncharacterized protein (TIGR02996 family)
MITRPELAVQSRGFLRAITEEPGNDTHRLVYADWLDEMGFDLRAGFIRRSILHPPPRPQSREWWEDDPEPNDLERLERAHGRDWSWPFDWLVDGWKDVRFDRGFATLIDLAPAQLVRHAPILFRYLPITRVILRPPGGTRPVVVGRDCRVLYDAGLVRGGPPAARLLTEIFQFLDKTGLPVEITGAAARLPGYGGGAFVSRAAVCFGRAAAGLPPLTPQQFDTVSPVRPASLSADLPEDENEEQDG